MLADYAPDSKIALPPAGEKYSYMSSMQRELFVFGGAAKDSLASAIEQPLETAKLLGVGAVAGVAYAALSAKAPPVALAMDVVGTFAAAKLVPAAISTFTEGKQIWNRTWKGTANLESDRHEAKAITDDVADFAIASVAGMVGPAMRSIQFRRQWKSLGDIDLLGKKPGLIGKKPVVPIDADLARTYRTAKPAIGRVLTSDEKQTEGGTGYGTGFCVDRDGTFLTCAHVMEYAEKVNVYFPGQRLYGASLLASDEKLDLALLRLTKHDPSESFPFVPLNEPPVPGDRTVMAIGFQTIAKRHKILTTLGKFDLNNTKNPTGTNGLFMRGMPGLSGSPILDGDGNVLSMLMAVMGTTKKEIAQLKVNGGSYGVGVPNNDLRQFVLANRDRQGTPLKEWEGSS